MNRVFNRMTEHDLAVWNAMMLGMRDVWRTEGMNYCLKKWKDWTQTLSPSISLELWRDEMRVISSSMMHKTRKHSPHSNMELQNQMKRNCFFMLSPFDILHKQKNPITTKNSQRRREVQYQNSKNCDPQFQNHICACSWHVMNSTKTYNREIWNCQSNKDIGSLWKKNCCYRTHLWINDQTCICLCSFLQKACCTGCEMGIDAGNCILVLLVEWACV